MWYVDIIILGFGLVVCLSVMFMEWLIPKIFPGFFKHWTLGKALIWYALVVLVVSFSNFLYKSFWAGFEDFNWVSFGLIFKRTISICILVLLSTMGLIFYFSKSRFRGLMDREKCIILGENEEKFECDFHDILYFESDNNYVDLHLLIGGIRKKRIIRSSLKKIENQLMGSTSPILRCHRRYLINTNHFQIITKNSRSLILGVTGQPDRVQVSRNHVNEILRSLPIDTKLRPIPPKEA